MTVCWGAQLFPTRKSGSPNGKNWCVSQILQNWALSQIHPVRHQLFPWVRWLKITGYDRFGVTSISGYLYLIYWHYIGMMSMSFNTGNTWYRKVYGEKEVFIPSLSQLIQFPSLEFYVVRSVLRFFPETTYS